MNGFFLKKSKGFTLIELMLVIAIIGVLASIAIPKFADLTTRAREATTKGRLGSLRSAISIYYGDNDGMFPGDPANTLIAGKKYLSEIPRADLPPYHSGNQIVLGGQIRTEVAGFNSNVWWSYIDPANFGLSVDSGFFGQIAVACSHQDSKGVTWSSY